MFSITCVIATHSFAINHTCFLNAKKEYTPYQSRLIYMHSHRKLILYEQSMEMM
jgi:hypothetical protein